MAEPKNLSQRFAQLVVETALAESSDKARDEMSQSLVEIGAAVARLDMGMRAAAADRGAQLAEQRRETGALNEKLTELNKYWEGVSRALREHNTSIKSLKADQEDVVRELKQFREAVGGQLDGLRQGQDSIENRQRGLQHAVAEAVAARMDKLISATAMAGRGRVNDADDVRPAGNPAGEHGLSPLPSTPSHAHGVAAAELPSSSANPSTVGPSLPNPDAAPHPAEPRDGTAESPIPVMAGPLATPNERNDLHGDRANPQPAAADAPSRQPGVEFWRRLLARSAPFLLVFIAGMAAGWLGAALTAASTPPMPQAEVPPVPPVVSRQSDAAASAASALDAAKSPVASAPAAASQPTIANRQAARPRDGDRRPNTSAAPLARNASASASASASGSGSADRVREPASPR